MNFLKSHFSFNKRQRNGVFFLLLLIISLQLIFFYGDFSMGKLESISKNQLVAFEREKDSLESIKIENRNPKIYPFNPNFISDFKGYQLGMSLAEIDRLHSYRAKNKFVNSVIQF